MRRYPKYVAEQAVKGQSSYSLLLATYVAGKAVMGWSSYLYSRQWAGGVVRKPNAV